MTTPDNNQTDGLDVVEQQRLAERERAKRLLADAENPLFMGAPSRIDIFNINNNDNVEQQ